MSNSKAGKCSGNQWSKHIGSKQKQPLSQINLFCLRTFTKTGAGRENAAHPRDIPNLPFSAINSSPEIAMTASKPELRQRMTLHLNGGREFSELHYEITADGKPTGITRRVRTSGSPQYLKTVDELQAGDDGFDVLMTKGAGLMEWIEAHLGRDAT
jgi:hypothetical protein